MRVFQRLPRPEGKARNPYRFGVKVSVATTLKEGIVVGMRSMPGDPWDGHTLEETLEQVGILTDCQPKVVIVDKGHQGVEVSKSIALLLPDLRGGGAERVAVNLANAFARSGFKVEVLLMSADGVFLADLLQEIRVVDLKRRRFRYVLLPLARHLRRRRPDALLAFMWPLTVIALWACWLSCRETRVVVAEHTTWSKDEIARAGITRLIVRATMRTSFPRADVVVTVSDGAADDLASFAQIDRSCIHVIHNPVVEKDAHIEIIDSVEFVRVEGWWTDSHRRVLAVGALKHIKDYPTLLRAFAALRLRVDARLLILGEGECRSELAALIRRLCLENFVFMPGFVRYLTPYYRRADLHVLSSTGEGFGNVIVEALSAGTPVVSTDCQSGPREILLDGRFGSLVPVADPKALAVAMENALLATHDPESLKARAQDFSIDKAATKYLALLFPDRDISVPCKGHT